MLSKHRLITPKVNTVLLIIAVLLLAFFFYSPTDSWRWDPSFYYAQIRSPIIDRDFNFRDETIPTNGVSIYTERGLQPSLWPVGPSVLWGPFFLIAHWLTLLFEPETANGTSNLYKGFVSAGSASFGIIGLLALYRLCRLFVQKGPALLTTILALFATPLFYYIFLQPFMAHSSNFLFTTAVVFACVLFEKDEIPLKWSGLILGVFTGICSILRWSGLLIGIIPAGLFGFRILDALKKGNTSYLRNVVIQLFIFILAIFLCITPQLATWYQLHGKWLVNPQSSLSIPFTPKHYAYLFFHTNRGVIFWCPYIIIGLAGLPFLPFRRLRLLFILYIVIFLLPLGFRRDWYGGGGFGARYFLDILPITSMGFLFLSRDAFTRPWAKYLIVLLSILLIFQQLSFWVAFEYAGQLGWLDYPLYHDGKQIGLRFFISTPINLLRQPKLLLTNRPTIFNNLVRGSRDVSLYTLPLLGMLVSSITALGSSLIIRCPLSKILILASVLLVLHQIAWFFFFINI